MAVDVAPGTVAVYTDVVCAWSTVALQRFYAARSRLDLDERVRVDHRLYPLEDVNSFAIPMRMLQAEIRWSAAWSPTSASPPGGRSRRTGR